MFFSQQFFFLEQQQCNAYVNKIYNIIFYTLEFITFSLCCVFISVIFLYYFFGLFKKEEI